MENEVLKQTFAAQIAGQIAGQLIKVHATDQDIIDHTINITKGIVDGLYT
jgi:hypothetical protein